MTICRFLVDFYVFLSTILLETGFNCRPHKIDNGKWETGKTAYKVPLKSRQMPTQYYKNLQICGQNNPKKPTKTDKKLGLFGIACGAIFRRDLGFSNRFTQNCLHFRIVVYNCGMTNFAFTWRDFSFFAFTNRGN